MSKLKIGGFGICQWSADPLSVVDEVLAARCVKDPGPRPPDQWSIESDTENPKSVDFMEVVH